MGKQLKAVLFDLYGTLLDIRTDENDPDTWERFACWMRNHGMPALPEELRREFVFGQRMLNAMPSAFQYPDPDMIPLFTAMCRSRKQDAPDSLVWASAKAFRCASVRFLKLYQESISTLDFLRAKGIQTILLSNAQRSFTWQELEMTGLVSHLDHIFISSDAGCRKPDPVFFRLALNHLGLQPDECIMVGNDGSSDIAGAKSVGMDAVYLRTAISPDEPLPDCRWVFEDGNIGHVKEIVG